MKRISLILILLSLMLGSLFAQADMGITLGLNRANISPKDTYRNKDRTGFRAGAFVQYKSGESFIVQPEILFTQKGYEPGLFADPFLSLSYVQIPVNFKYNLGVSELSIQPYIGPNISYLVAAKKGYKKTDWDVLDDLQRLEYGLDFGVDVVLLKHFMAGLRYDMGLSKIYKEAPLVKDTYNRTFMLNLSFILGSSN